MLRRVVFPDRETQVEIERLLLLRPVDDVRGQTDLERAGLARAIINVQFGAASFPSVPILERWRNSRRTARTTR